jgi:uncharacterized protein (TIGR03437 family)
MALPLLSVSPRHVKILLLPEILPGVYKLQVESASRRSNEVAIPVAVFAPGIFTLNETGRGPGVFFKEDGTPVSTTNPADRGGTVIFYATGLGAVEPPIAPGEAGAVTEPLNRTVHAPRVFFDLYAAQVIYSGLARGVAGRYEVVVRVPAQVPPATNVSVSMTVEGHASNRVTIPVR